MDTVHDTDLSADDAVDADGEQLVRELTANRLMDRIAETQLSSRESRVVATIARKTLGYSKLTNQVATQIARMRGLGRSHVVVACVVQGPA
jgi:hypothetical protein